MIETSRRTEAGPGNWSRLNIALHWLVALLIAVQLLDHEGMVAWWDSYHDEGAASANDIALGWLHIAAGVLIFAFSVLRIWDRTMRGRPPYPTRNPSWVIILSKLTHFLLFAILIVMPLGGIAAWLTNSELLAGIHTFLWTPLLILVGLHVLGALAEQFVFRTNALRRMVTRNS